MVLARARVVVEARALGERDTAAVVVLPPRDAERDAALVVVAEHRMDVVDHDGDWPRQRVS